MKIGALCDLLLGFCFVQSQSIIIGLSAIAERMLVGGIRRIGEVGLNVVVLSGSYR